MRKIAPALRMTAVLLSLTLPVLAQAAAGNEGAPAPGGSATVPYVRFLFDFHAVQPQHFELSVDAAGNARYLSRPEAGEEAFAPEDVFETAFVVSEATRARIFRTDPPPDQWAGVWTLATK